MRRSTLSETSTGTLSDGTTFSRLEFHWSSGQRITCVYLTSEESTRHILRYSFLQAYYSPRRPT